MTLESPYLIPSVLSHGEGRPWPLGGGRGIPEGDTAQMVRGGGLLQWKRIKFLSLHSWNEGPGAKLPGPGQGQPTFGT